MASPLWTENAFVSELRRREGDDIAEVARRLLAWAEQHRLQIVWGRGEITGSFAPKVRISGKVYSTFRARTNGRLDFPDALRQEIGAIPGATIVNETARERPAIELAALVERDRFRRFLAVWERYLADLHRIS